MPLSQGVCPGHGAVLITVIIQKIMRDARNRGQCATSTGADRRSQRKLEGRMCPNGPFLP